MGRKRIIDDFWGKRFGSLIAIKMVVINKRTFWECTCDCGQWTTVKAAHLRNGTTKSCGCGRIKHGQHGTPEYRIWQSMLARCTNPKHEHFDRYGGRGISICPEWRSDFAAFFAAVGKRPSAAHSIDRINNDGNYEPSNVRWATRNEQAANRKRPRGRRRSELDGQKISVREMAAFLAISWPALKHLLEASE